MLFSYNVKQTETKSTSLTVKKVAKKAVAKGTYYKFIVVALNSKDKVVSTSKTVHAATLGGKVGNAKKLTTKAKKNKVSLKKKKTFKPANALCRKKKIWKNSIAKDQGSFSCQFFAF